MIDCKHKYTHRHKKSHSQKREIIKKDKNDQVQISQKAAAKANTHIAQGKIKYKRKTPPN